MSSLDPPSLETRARGSLPPASPPGQPVGVGGDEEPPDHTVQPLEAPPRRFRRWHIGAGFIVLLLLAAIVASFVNVPYYAITPGSAQPVAALIVVPGSLSHAHKGSVSLVDVQLVPMRAIEWIYFELDPAATVVPTGSVLGPESAAQYNVEGILDMQDAQQAATVVALDNLGFKVSAVPSGALLYALLPGSPAEASLAVGDVVTSVDGLAVTSAGDLSARLLGRRPGEQITVGYGAYPTHSHRSTSFRLGEWHLKGTGAEAQLDCLPLSAHTTEPVARLLDHGGVLSLPGPHQVGAPVACMGVLQAETSYRTGALPLKVDLSSEGIVGPSAGLAFTLGLMEKLDRADLTGGHRVAATGTMSVTGQVGPIGGIQQKTIAVRNAGDSIFLVPPANYAIAKKYAGSQLKVFAVSTISQALAILERFGGKVVPPAIPAR